MWRTSSVNQTVKLPRWRKLASYSRQFMILRFCLGKWGVVQNLPFLGYTRHAETAGL